MRYPQFTGTEPCTEVGTNLFFAEEGETGRRDLAHIKALCATCPMQAACLEWALAYPEPFGIWGGLTTQERSRLRRSRRSRAASAA